MRRSPAIILLAAIAVVALTARLGVWQLDRAAQKSERQALLAQRQSLPPVGAEVLSLQGDLLESLLYRRIALRGTWDDARTVFLDNRAMQGRAGFVVVTPMRMRDGSAVLVQRGWQPRDLVDRTRVRPPPTSSGEVELSGLIAPPPSRLYEFEGAASGAIRQNIDVDGFAAETGLPLVPVSILQLDEPAPAGPVAVDGLVRQWELPSESVHKHYAYAAQWFAMSALTLGLYVWFQLLRPRLGSRAR